MNQDHLDDLLTISSEQELARSIHFNDIESFNIMKNGFINNFYQQFITYNIIINIIIQKNNFTM